MEKYEQPGERLHSKVPSDEYKEAYDRIFGKKQYWYEKKLKNRNCNTCGVVGCDYNYMRQCGSIYSYWEPKKEKDETSETPVQTD